MWTSARSAVDELLKMERHPGQRASVPCMVPQRDVGVRVVGQPATLLVDMADRTSGGIGPFSRQRLSDIEPYKARLYDIMTRT